MVENEIHFLNWDQFRRMAPPIVRLEVTRLSRLLVQCGPDAELHNALVKARYELEQFITCIQRGERDRAREASVAHLEAAMLVLSMTEEDERDRVGETLDYVADRLRYVHDRIGWIR